MKQNGKLDYSALRQSLIEERDELVRQANQQIAFINGKIALLEELENPVKPQEIEPVTVES